MTDLNDDLEYRRWLAGMALNGVASSNPDCDDWIQPQLAKWCWEMADNIIAQENHT